MAWGREIEKAMVSKETKRREEEEGKQLIGTGGSRNHIFKVR